MAIRGNNCAHAINSTGKPLVSVIRTFMSQRSFTAHVALAKSIAQTTCCCLFVHVATPTIFGVDDDACLFSCILARNTNVSSSLSLFRFLGLSWEQLVTFATAN